MQTEVVLSRVGPLTEKLTEAMATHQPTLVSGWWYTVYSRELFHNKNGDAVVRFNLEPSEGPKIGPSF